MNTYTNYQLYRTNPKLSGQLKWNLIVSDDISSLSVSDFQLVPISNNALNINPIKHDLILNKHIDNLKRYYELNSKYFYNDYDYIDMQFKTNESIKNDNLDLYPTTYNMGCKRALYTKNQKQFEFFCPLWLEKVESSIEFRLNVYSENKLNNTNALMSSKSLKFDMSKCDDSDYNVLFNKSLHTNFTNYLNNYLYESGIKNGNNSIGKIEFVESKKFSGSTKFTNNCLCLKQNVYENDDVILNEFNQVSLLTETDNSIISAINNSSCICPQLLNFNLCFNLEDIISDHVFELFAKNLVTLNISMDVYVDGVLLETKDFDSEYDFIRKTLIYDTTDNKLNRYIEDKEASNSNYFNVFGKYNISTSNDLYNSLCHWALCANDKYLINTFTGFEGISINYDANKNICEYYNNYQYNDTPDIFVKGDPLLGDCSTRWINTKYIDKWDDFYKYVQYTNEYKTDGTYVSTDNDTFINGIKYYNIPEKLKNTYILGVVLTKRLLSNILNNFKCLYLYGTDKLDALYAYQIDNMLILLTTDARYLTFNRVKNTVIKDIFNRKNYWILTNLIQLMSNSVIPFKTVELNDINSQCFRYDGEIKPKFTSNPSTIKYVDLIPEDFKIQYSYNAIRKTRNWTYDNVPKVKTTKNSLKSIINTDNEYSWFNKNRCMPLKPEISFKHIIDIKNISSISLETKNMIRYDINGEEFLKQISIEKLIEIYGLDKNSSSFNKTVNYLLNLYYMHTSWDFVDDNPSKYEVNITLKLR